MADPLTSLVQLAPKLVDLAQRLITASGEAERLAQTVEFQKALIGLQSLIASVQQENATLASQKRDAEEALKRVEDWGHEKQRYQMAVPTRGCTVFALQRSQSHGEPPHYICAACYQQGKKSILQNIPQRDTWNAWACPACKAIAITGYRGSSPAKFAEDIPAAE